MRDHGAQAFGRAGQCLDAFTRVVHRGDRVTDLLGHRTGRVRVALGHFAQRLHQIVQRARTLGRRARRAGDGIHATSGVLDGSDDLGERFSGLVGTPAFALCRFGVGQNMPGGLGARALDAPNELGDLLGLAFAAFGQLAHLTGDNSKAAALTAGTRGFDGLRHDGLR